MLETCVSTCPLARFCARHSINNPLPQMRNTRQTKYRPELEKDCPGYIEPYLDDDDTDT
jgi:hypothetical protein